MKFSLVATGLALASSVAGELVTLSSTIVSSTCSLGLPYYGNSTTSGETIIYETEQVTAQKTLTLIKTVCNSGSCSVTTELNALETVVTTVDGVLTTYVHAVPVTSSKAAVDAVATETATNIKTTVVTVTSCANNKCQTSAVTTGLTTVTKVVDGVSTVYTTYCPLSSAADSTDTKTSQSPAATTTNTVAAESVVKTKASAAADTTVKSKASSAADVTVKSKASSAAETTVNVITNNIVTQSSAAASTQATTVAHISTYAGGANRALPLALGAIPALLMLA